MSRYEEAHKNTKGPGDARPTALQIVEDEGLVDALTDKVFLVTGVSSGIGIETMRALYATGGHVFGTVRDTEKGKQVVEEIKLKTQSKGKISLIEMEMDSLASVKKGANEFLEHCDKLNVLVCNAGVMTTPESKTRDGFETQFGINHLAHFYFFQLLKPALLSSATTDFPSRVVSVTSHGHRSSSIRPGDYHFAEPGSYKPPLAYGQSKTANIYFANEIDRRFASQHLHATSVHPGGIKTNITRHVPPAMLDTLAKIPAIETYFKSPEQGAATTVYAALSTEWKGKGGKYLSDCVEAKPFGGDGGNPIKGMTDDGYAEWAYDEDKASCLWEDSLKMMGLGD